jgi:hypothetical protein
MPFKPFSILIAGLLLFSLACLPARYTMQDLPGEQLRFGAYGGFAGSHKEYIMLKNGQVFLLESLGARRDTSQLESFAGREVRPLFKRLDSLRLHKYDFNYPGNMTWFLRQIGETTDITVQWGDPVWDVRADVADFHRELNAFVKDRKELPKEEVAPEKPKEPTFW